MISTHILDTSKGVPAAGVQVRLQTKTGGTWTDISHGATNADGRFVFDSKIAAGVYQIVFAVEKYLEKEAKAFFFQDVHVAFKIDDVARKYHVPLLLNPYGYSTYRGS